MKKTLLATAIAALMLSACGETPNLRGDISGVESDTALIYLSNLISGKWIDVDTVALQHGHFETSLSDSIPMEISLVPKNKYGECKTQIIGQSFYFFPGDHLTLKGELPYGIEASGTQLYDLLAKDKNYMGKATELSRLTQEIATLEMTETSTDSLEAAYDEKERELNEASLAFIKKHPDTRAAAYLALQQEGSIGVEAISLLSDEVKKGDLAPLIAEYDEYFKNAVETEKNKEQIQPGIVAPDFTLVNLDGNKKSLTDFRGKYVILDFWGTWCGWCLAGIPEMARYYEKYCEQVEFVGICCSDKADRWRKCVKKRNMTWTQLFDADDTTPMTYGVDGFPTKIILDKEGKIEQIFEGESQDFYDYLDRKFQ